MIVQKILFDPCEGQAHLAACRKVGFTLAQVGIVLRLSAQPVPPCNRLYWPLWSQSLPVHSWLLKFPWPLLCAGLSFSQWLCQEAETVACSRILRL